MMNILLPRNYEGDKYGVQFRLVEESDADFIFKLRSDKNLSRYIHDIEGGPENQRTWIQLYKEREAKGEEYYFIFFNNSIPIGVIRLYGFHGKTFTSGSWVMQPGTPSEYVLAVPIIAREIAFEELGMEMEDNYDACHIDNKKVIRFNERFGCKIYKHFQDVKGEYVAMSLTKSDFEERKPKLLRMIGY